VVICKLCDKQFHFLGRHLTARHDINTDEYLRQFPGSSTISDECSNRRSASQLNAWSQLSDEERSDRGVQWRAGWTEESRLKMIKSKIDRYASMTADEREIMCQRMRDMGDDFHHAPEYTEIRERRAKSISDTWRDRLSEPEFYGAAVDRMLYANSHMHKWLKTCSSDEMVEWLGNSFCRKPSKFKYTYKGHDVGVRTSYEKKMAETLIDLGLDYSYEGYTIPCIDGSRYWPDFTIEGLKLIFEVKAQYYFDEYKNFQCQLASMNAGYVYYLFLEDDLFSKNLHETIGNITTSALHNWTMVDELIAQTSASSYGDIVRAHVRA